MKQRNKYDWKNADKELGVLSDSDVSDKYGIPRVIVANRRIGLGIPRIRKWSKFEPLLGKVKDCEIADAMGISTNAVTRKRIRMSIASNNAHLDLSIQKAFAKSVAGEIERDCIYGRCDVFADDTVYEVKGILSFHNALCAIGQLYLYTNGTDYKKAIVTSSISISDNMIDAIKSIGIDVVVFDVKTRDITYM